MTRVMPDLQKIIRAAEWRALFDDTTGGLFWEPAFGMRPEAGRPMIAVVRDAVVLSNPAVLGVLRGEHLHLFKESTPYPDRERELRRLTFEFVPPDEPSRAFYTRMAPLCCEWSENFWHWMTECVPYALELERLGFDGSYLVPKESSLYIDTLVFFGIPVTRIVAKSADISSIEEMYVPNRADGQQARYPALIRAMRDAANDRCSLAPQPRRLYIARRTRVIINDNDVIPILKDHGFETVYMEDRSLAEQIELACQSEFICGAHGAGLTAAMFMQDGGRLLECFAPSYINPCMLGICESLNHRYSMIVSRQYRESPYQDGLNVRVDLPSLRAALSLLNG